MKIGGSITHDTLGPRDEATDQVRAAKAIILRIIWRRILRINWRDPGLGRGGVEDGRLTAIALVRKGASVRLFVRQSCCPPHRWNSHESPDIPSVTVQPWFDGQAPDGHPKVGGGDAPDNVQKSPPDNSQNHSYAGRVTSPISRMITSFIMRDIRATTLTMNPNPTSDEPLRPATNSPPCFRRPRRRPRPPRT